MQRAINTNPVNVVRTLAQGFPVAAPGSLGTDGFQNPSSWGHMSNDVRHAWRHRGCCMHVS